MNVDSNHSVTIVLENSKECALFMRIIEAVEIGNLDDYINDKELTVEEIDTFLFDLTNF